MRRRQFIAGIAGAVTAWPRGVRAQSASKVHRVGFVLTTALAAEMTGPEPVNPNARAFVQGMRALGYVEGQNLIVERRSAEGNFDRLGEIVTELVSRNSDVIVSAGNELALRAKRMAPAMPVVFVNSSDPVAAGLADRLSQPGGNITGLTGSTGPEFEAKRLQWLKDTVPGASRIAFLGTRSDWENDEGTSVRAAARVLDMTMILAEHTPTNFADAVALLARERPHAVFVARRPGTYANRKTIVDFAVNQRLPGIYPYREFVEAGGLMSYGASLFDLYRRAAGYVDKILKGARPGDLPVEQPTKFELVVNQNAARLLGLTIPTPILALADEVIE